MPELAKFETMVIYSNNSSLTVGSGAKAIVFKEGATVNGHQTIFKSSTQATTAITVYDIGQFVANDYAKVGSGGSVTGTVSSTGGTTTITFNGSAADIDLPDGTRLIRLGLNSSGSSPGTSVYSEDTGNSTALTNSVVTADSNGNMKFWAAAGDYDILIQNSAQTSDLYLIQDASLNLIANNTGVTFITNSSDDFAIGGSSTAAPFYFDTSAEDLVIGGTSAPYIDIDGANGKITIRASTDPQLVLQGASTTTLKSSATQARIFTFPDVADGTVLVTTGTQNNISGAKTFTGGVTISTTASTISSALTLSGAVTSSGGITLSSGLLKTGHIIGDQTTALTSGSVTNLTTGCAYLSIAGSDQRFLVGVTISGGPRTDPSFRVNFASAYANAPYAVGSLEATSGADVPVWIASTVGYLTITLKGSVANGNYLVYVIVLG